VPLTLEEFAAREPLWNAKVLKQQEALERAEAEKQQRKRERRKCWPSGNGKIRLRLPPRLPPTAISRALAAAAASSRSAPADDCYPRRTRAGQVAFKWFVSLMILD
jgi:hypothetical protein